MPRYGPTPPNRSNVLFDNLFGEVDRTATLETISSGISSVIENAGLLLADADVLAQAKRYERAEFLAATAREEMGKIYVLVDICRLNFGRHEGLLRGLCKAFYGHEIKHAYFELSARRYPGIINLAEMKRAFRNETQRWWPSGYESGEPDMPHDVYFYRELNLYVDFDNYAKTWSIPKMPAKALIFESEFLGTPVTRAEEVLKRISATRDIELFEPDKLEILNRHFSLQTIDDRTDTHELERLYQRVGEDLEREFGLSSDRFEDSEVHNWPLYSFL